MSAAPTPPASTPPAPPPHDGAGRRRATSRPVVVLLWAVAAGVLLQAVFAGLFLSGTAGARVAHVVVGWLLPWFAVAVAVVTATAHVRGRCPPGVAIATYVLPVLLYAQEILGHIPVPVTTAVHVPFGVGLAMYAVALALLAARPAREPPGASRAPGPAGLA